MISSRISEASDQFVVYSTYFPEFPILRAQLLVQFLGKNFGVSIPHWHDLLNECGHLHGERQVLLCLLSENTDMNLCVHKTGYCHCIIVQPPASASITLSNDIYKNDVG